MKGKKLTPEQIEVLRNKATEAPFSGKYLNNNQDGMYVCAACGNNLFDSNDKFDSSSGWPSFSDVVSSGNVVLAQDSSHGMIRTEVSCANCGGHLGHVFDDGPTKSKVRYCINSASLDFTKRT